MRQHPVCGASHIRTYVHADKIYRDVNVHDVLFVEEPGGDAKVAG